MNGKKWIAIVLLFTTFVFILRDFPSTRLKILVCNVGQGDGIVISQGYNQLVIDARDARKIVACLDKVKPFWDKRLEMVVVTHPEIDHFGGIEELFKRYDVSLWVTNGMESNSNAWSGLVREALDEHTKIFVPRQGDVLRLGNLELTVLWPKGRQGDVDELVAIAEKTELKAVDVVPSLNQWSIVLKLKYGEFDGLFMGDAGEEEERSIVEAGLVNDVELLKVGHHGSKYSTSELLLEHTHPDLAVISVGKNSFGHPTDEVLTRLEKVDTRVLRTDLDGDVVVESDGRKWWVVGR